MEAILEKETQEGIEGQEGTEELNTDVLDGSASQNDDEVVVANIALRRTLAEKIKADTPNGSAFSRAFHRFFVTTGLTVAEFKPKADDLLDKIEKGLYPVNARRKVTAIKGQLDVLDKLVEYYGDDSEGLNAFMKKPREEREAILNSIQ